MSVEKTRLEKCFRREFVETQDNFKAICPIHDERSPSFFVHADEGLAHCFGCGVSGYVETILAQYKNIGVSKAAELLNIDQSERLLQKVGLKKRESLGLNSVFFPESWLAPWPKEIHKYILGRLGKDAITILKSAGVRFDPVTRRQVFPHRDREGRLVGAFGRATDGREPKYYFYWGYKKGECLYDPWTSSGDKIVVTEGPLDVLKLRELNIDAASTLGTQFSTQQLRRLKQYEEVIIAYDNDEEGRIAARKLYLNLCDSTKVKFIDWPDHRKDFVDLGDRDLILELVNNSISYVQGLLIR